MRNTKVNLYKSIGKYFVVEEMRNETTMWYVAAGLLLQLLNERYSAFGALKSKIGYDIPRKGIDILDVCSGPGTFANYLSFAIPNLNVTCVDSDEYFINYGKTHFKKWKFIKANAVKMDLSQKFPVICISSGYHHIEDIYKIKFLKNIKDHLKKDGIILLCENFLPPYKDKRSRDKAIKIYYQELRKYYSNGNASREAVKVLDDVENRDLNNTEEHKVSFDVFKEHVALAGLKVDQTISVWQPDSDDFGSRVLILKK